MSAVQTKSTIETNLNCSAWLRFKMNSKIGLKHPLPPNSTCDPPQTLRPVIVGLP